MDTFFGNNAENSGLLVVGTLSALIGAHLVLSFILRSFKRDGYKSFGYFGDATSLLSNSDSVLGRDGVKGSIEGYEGLFSGARKQVGTTTTSESIEKREKEYATMVNSFYDLVTDFYEWGWGQVSYIACTSYHYYLYLVKNFSSHGLRLCSVQYSHFILRPASRVKHSRNQSTELSTILR